MHPGCIDVGIGAGQADMFGNERFGEVLEGSLIFKLLLYLRHCLALDHNSWSRALSNRLRVLPGGRQSLLSLRPHHIGFVLKLITVVQPFTL